MADRFYRTVRFVGRSAFWVSSSPLIIGEEHTARAGGFLLAANHQSPYDIPLLIRHTARTVDFVSIVEVFRNPLVGWFYGSMNAFPLDRSRPDVPTVRTILDRLSRGRCVGLFPEGGFRNGGASVVHSLRVKPGTARIARIANVSIVPAVIIGSGDYRRFSAWLPTRRTRYGIIFGQAIPPGEDDAAGDAFIAQRLAELHQTLSEQLGRSIPNHISTPSPRDARKDQFVLSSDAVELPSAHSNASRPLSSGMSFFAPAASSILTLSTELARAA